MKVIFLDFDGVLNSEQEVRMYHRKGVKPHEEFCPIACSNLQYVLEEVPEARIVVSSTWRVLETEEDLRRILRANGIDADRVIGITPTGKDGIRYEGERTTRGCQIRAWLEANPHVTEYVIFDDDSDMLPEQLPRFIQTDCQHGLMLKEAKRAVGVLTGTTPGSAWA